MMTTALTVVSATETAWAQGAPSIQQAQRVQALKNFDIPAQPLTDALVLFGRQSGVQVSVEAAVVRNVGSPGVRGSMTAEQALGRLLAGTGITYRLTGGDTAMLERPQAGDGTLTLDPVVVEGRASSPTAMLGNLPPPYAGGQVATGGRLGMLGNRSVMNTPFSQTSYTKKTIEDQQARTLADVLANEPSVIMSQGAMGGINEFWSFRGFMTQTYTGGHSLNGLPAMSPMQFPSTDYIERVDVLRGPGALLNGTSLAGHGALGGSVNLVTKKAGNEPVTQLTTRYMSDLQLGAHIDFGRRFGKDKEFGIRFNGSLDRGDTAVDTQRARFGTGALNLDYRGKRIRLSADLAHQRQHLTAPNSVLRLGAVAGVLPNLARVPKAPGSSTAFSPSWGRSTHEISLGMVQGEVDILDDVTVYGAIGKQRYKSHANVGALSLLDSSGSIGLRSQYYREQFDVLSMQGGVRAKVDAGPVAHAFSLDLLRVRYTASFTDQSRATGGVGSTVPVGTIYDPDFPILPMTGDPGDPVKANIITASSIGVADTMSLLDERIQITAGVRYQGIRTRNFGGSVSIVGQQANYEASAWSPSFAVVVKPWNNVSLYGSYIENLQPGTSVGSGYSNSGQVFPPYRSKQYEAGVKVDWGSVTTTLAAFQIAQPSTLSVPDAAGGLPSMRLAGEQRNRGIELTAYGELFDGFRLLGGVTFIDARRTKTGSAAFDGTRAAGVPEFRAVLGGEWGAPFVKGLTVTGRLTYTSDVVVANSRPGLTVPSWTQVDLGARYTFDSPWNAKPVTLRFGVDNVFDKNYWKVMHVVGNLYRSTPRTFRLSTTFDF